MAGAEFRWFLFYPIVCYRYVSGGVNRFLVYERPWLLNVLACSQLGWIDHKPSYLVVLFTFVLYVTPSLWQDIVLATRAWKSINFWNLPRYFTKKWRIICAAYILQGLWCSYVLLCTNCRIQSCIPIVTSLFFKFFRSNIGNLFVGFFSRLVVEHFYWKWKKAMAYNLFYRICIVNTVARNDFVAVILLCCYLCGYLGCKEFIREKFVYSWCALTVEYDLFGCVWSYALRGYYAATAQLGHQLSITFVFSVNDVWFNDWLV